MLCKKCGSFLRESARFCPTCGLAIEDPSASPAAEYSYETLQNLYPWKAVVPIILLLWLPFTAIGVLVAWGEGFWFVPVLMSGIVLFAIFAIAWANKGKKKRWGVDRTLWILTPEGYAVGYPPDVAKRIGMIGAASAATTAGNQNWGVTSLGINMAKNLASIQGLPITPWTDFISAAYHPEKREIVLHLPTGSIRMIYTNPDNYPKVEQLVRGYIGRR